MKKILCALTILSMIISITACNAKCEKCDKITELQAEADELREFLENYNVAQEGTAEDIGAQERLASIKEQLVVLAQHECSLPAEKVKNVEYKLGDYSGTYTGEWKSGVAHGQGSFEGVDNYNNTLTYEGEFIGGELTGYGVYNSVGASSGNEQYYEGDFVENQFHGDGFLRQTYAEEIVEKTGKWVKSKFITGEYTVKDRYGNVTDYGTYEDGVLTYSAEIEASKKRDEEIKKQSEQNATNFIVGVFDGLF